MAVTIRSAEALKRMREAGRKLEIVHEELRDFLRPGLSTREVDQRCLDLIRKLGAEPNFLAYRGFPASVCVSIDQEVVHGIPSPTRYLEEGQIVSLDTGLIWQGYHADAARTWGIGKISDEAGQLIEATRQAFFAGIRQARAHQHLYDISAAIESYATDHGCQVVEGLSGHGIGRHLHEYPTVPNVGQKGRGMILEAGMTFAVEPTLALGRGEVETDETDGWTVRTLDQSPAAHYENTILITEGEAELLTCTKGE